MREEGIVENAARIGSDILGPGLRELQERHPSIGDVRGLGAFWVLDLVKDRTTREMLVPYGAHHVVGEPMQRLIAECRRNGLWPHAQWNRLFVTPPCNTNDEDCKVILSGLDAALAVVD
jgi:taurine---2-oxoglutarate transaminase